LLVCRSRTVALILLETVIGTGIRVRHDGFSFFRRLIIARRGDMLAGNS
jgi:hypothetical protein